jgi:hypothetical protein
MRCSIPRVDRCRCRRLHIVVCRHMLCLDYEQVGPLSLLLVSAVCRLCPAIRSCHLMF